LENLIIQGAFVHPFEMEARFDIGTCCKNNFKQDHLIQLYNVKYHHSPLFLFANALRSARFIPEVKGFALDSSVTLLGPCSSQCQYPS
jgi:hypothetical protein